MVTRLLLDDESGATAVVIGLSMTALLGFAGMGVDIGVWYSDKRAAQAAADSAAYSAAVDYGANDTTAGAETAGRAVAARDGYTNGSGGVTVTVNSPPTSGTHKTTTGAMEVIVTKSESLFFSSLFLNSASVSARAVAVPGTSGGGGSPCILAKNNMSASNGITINLSACGVQDNGTSSSALSVVGGASITAQTVAVVGGITMNNGGSITATTKTTGAPAVADPYANISVPTAGSCTSQVLPGYGTATLNPGTFCSGLSIGNGLQVTMTPGVYIIEGSGYSQQGGTTVNATGGVTLVLVNSGGNYAVANIANGSTLNITAPSTGATAGMAIMQDPNQNSSTINGEINNIAGGASVNVVGALYFPNETVDFSNGTTNNSKCTQLIAYNIVFTGGADFSNNCAGVGTTSIGAGATTTALVE